MCPPHLSLNLTFNVHLTTCARPIGHLWCACMKKTSSQTPKAPTPTRANAVTGGLKGKAAAPAPKVNHGAKAQASTVGATPAHSPIVKGQAAALQDTASSGKLAWVQVAGYRIEKHAANGKQTMVRVMLAGRVVREETRSTASVNALFMFGARAASLKVERDELNTSRSIALKERDTVRAAHLSLKLEANAADYAAAVKRAELAGVLEIMPEIKAPKARAPKAPKAPKAAQTAQPSA